MQMLTFDNFTDYLVPLTTLRRNTNKVIERVFALGKVIITKGGKPLFIITPFKKHLPFDKTPKLPIIV